MLTQSLLKRFFRAPFCVLPVRTRRALSRQRQPFFACAEQLEVRLLLSAVTITEFPTPNPGPFGIARGPDGNVWFTENTFDKPGLPIVGKVTPSGAVTEFSAGITPNTKLGGITAGPDGNLWFVEGDFSSGGHLRIGRITPTGTVTEFDAGANTGDLGTIATGPDGNLWFTMSVTNKIGRLNPTTGQFTFFGAANGISTNSHPLGIITGPDGNLWFTEPGIDINTVNTITSLTLQQVVSVILPAVGRIGRITPTGTVTEFSAGISSGGFPIGIATGPDGNMWFTEPGINKSSFSTTARIGIVFPNGSIAEYTNGIPQNGLPASIVLGPDNNLWFTEPGRSQIAQITTAGAVTEVGTGITPNSLPSQMVLGPDNNLWFTEHDANRIAKVTFPNNPPPPTHVPVLSVASSGSPLSQTILFYTGADHQVYEEKFDASQNLVSPAALVQAGAIGSSLSVITLPNGAPLVFLVGNDGQVYEAKFDSAGTLTSGFTLTQPGAVQSITATNDIEGDALVLAIGGDNQVYYQQLDASGTQTKGYTLVAPGAVHALSASGPVLFAQGLDNQIYENRFNGTTWSGYTLPAAGAVQSFSYSAVSGLLVGIGGDSQLYAQKIDANGNSGGWFLTAPGGIKGVSQGVYSGKTEIVVIGGDDQVYVQKFDAAGNSLGYSATSPGGVKSVFATTLPGSPGVFVVGFDNQVYQLKFDNVSGNVVGGYTASGSGVVS